MVRSFTWPWIGLLIGCGSYVFSGAAYGQSVLYVDDDATGANDGSSWPDAYNYLQDALAAAADSGGTVTEIRVAQGIYKPDQGADQTPGSRSASFYLQDGLALRGGYAGCGTPDPDERNFALYETLLSGDLNGDDWIASTYYRENSYHVVIASATDQTAILDGFSISGGYACPESEGGGLHIRYYGSPTVANCIFRDNVACGPWGYGGGVCNEGDSPMFTSCIFTNNTARGGGGLANRSARSPVLIDCVFSGNSTSPWYGCGGGVLNDCSENPLLLNCTFVANVAGRGAGMYSEHTDVTLVNSTFCGNVATYDGGALLTKGGLLTSTLTNCILWANAAPYGSQVCTVGWYYTSTTLTNCILWKNAAPYTSQICGDATVDHCCVQGGWISGTGNIDLDPLLVDPDGPDDDPDTWEDNDYHLAPTSPCINAGDNDAPGLPAHDFEGDLRVQHCRVDLGVDETPYYADCNGNGVADACDIAEGTSEDCTANRIPDECEPDCNGNAVADSCDVADGTSEDCTANGVPDECEPDCNENGTADSCDIADGTSEDCNANVIPDECEPDEDCNGNGIQDVCDIGGATSNDCNENNVLDECDIAGVTSADCTGNGVPDECEADCNENGVADSCDIAGPTSADCTDNGIPDECEPDCNGNGLADSCDIGGATSEDCNDNGVPDECDIAGDTSEDWNGNGIPDDCEGACCTGQVCTDTTQAECQAVEGYWVGGSLCPPAFPSNLCEWGACCLAPGWCGDEPDYDTEDECENEGGEYVGGATCRDDPCAVCQFRWPGYCHHEDPDGFLIPVDRAFGVRGADDFQPTGDVINRICWVAGFYAPGVGECTENPPPDAWQVTFYEDLDGLPDLNNVVAGPLDIVVERKQYHRRGAYGKNLAGLSDIYEVAAKPMDTGVEGRSCGSGHR